MACAAVILARHGGGAANSLAAYNRAMVEQQLGDEAAAKSGFRDALLMR